MKHLRNWMIGGGLLALVSASWVGTVWALDQWLVTEAELSQVLLQQERREIAGKIHQLELQMLNASADERALMQTWKADMERELRQIEALVK